MPARSSCTWPSGQLSRALERDLSKACAEAAQRILDADVLLLCTGAGFSADSGLAVYADVARVDAYAHRHLRYHDICQPGWLDAEPELFWGFWGQCFNDYRRTAPHDGYQMIGDWADTFFRQSDFADAVRRRLQKARWPMQAPEDPKLPYEVGDMPGAFFAFTSNVDAHHFDWFTASEIRECHGNVELYQCASGCEAIWRAPLNFRFIVDKKDMLAPAYPEAAPEEAEVEGSQESELCIACAGTRMLLNEQCPLCDGAGCFPQDCCEFAGQSTVSEGKPRIGDVRGGGRPFLLRHMPGTPPDATAAGFVGNHPKCPQCGSDARPAILMFGDWSWQDFDAQERRWMAWTAAVTQEMCARKDAGQAPVRAVVLELGAGNNVPTVRHTSESQLLAWHKAGADVKLVRINPDLPLADHPNLKPNGKLNHLVISIMARGLSSLRMIQSAMLVTKPTGDPPRLLGIESAEEEQLPEELANQRDWTQIRSAFETQNGGQQTLSATQVYNVAFSDKERSEYSLAEFATDLRSLRKLTGRTDCPGLDELTWAEVQHFFETFG